jgi:AraC-like DNA-binding protein
MNCVLPDGCLDVLFSTNGGERASLTVVGLMTAALTHGVDPAQSFFGVRFRPGMATAFLPGVALLRDQVEPLDSIWGARARSILDRLTESTGFEERARIMEASLRPAEPPGSGEQALQQLSANVAAMDRLAKEAGLSQRQFRRLCVQRAGVSPKYLSRILRFRSAVERISTLRTAAAQPSWAQFAAACGYFDQAHFIREFQEFAGMTPGRYLQSLHVGSA